MFDNEDMELLYKFFKYIITGVLTGYLLVFGLRPSTPYPEIILEPFDHKWMFLILFIINYYAFIWDEKIGYLLLICIIALLYDMILFTKMLNDDK